MTIISRYVKLTSPDYGGFGNTTIYDDTHLDRMVILKRINETTDRERLLDEIEALQKVKSKNVVQIYDIIASDQSELVLVEEFLTGNDLENFRASSENIEEFIEVLYQLSSGISDIHACEIVHRDFKPDNVKYDSEGLLKIFDFGLAKCKTLPTSTVHAFGAPGFMAPELFQTPPVIDKPVDCYAFGATAFYFVTGRPPQCALERPIPRELFESESIGNYIRVNKDVACIIDSCLEINPDNRPTMDAVRDILKKNLLYGKHKATVIIDNNTYELETIGKGIIISRGSMDSATIYYNGFDFVFRDIKGSVYVNNIRITDKDTLKGSSVISLGSPEEGGHRKFVTFDISYPEVLL